MNDEPNQQNEKGLHGDRVNREFSDPCTVFKCKDESKPDRIARMLMEIIIMTIRSLFQNDTGQFARTIGLNQQWMDKLRKLVANRRPNNNPLPHPRIIMTVEEHKTFKIIKQTWEYFVDKDDLFPKWDQFIRAVYSNNNNTRIDHETIKACLNHLGVSTLKAKRIPRVMDEANKRDRVKCATFFLKTITELKLEQGNDPNKMNENAPVMYFLDECSINQADLEDLLCLAPFHIQPFHPACHSITTESVSLILLVDQWGRICHYELRNTAESGANKSSHIIKFLTDALQTPLVKKHHDHKILYLDNAGIHKKAFKPVDQIKDENKKPLQPKVKEMIENVQKSWETLWSPCYTPESNLAEYFFRSLKVQIEHGLETTFHTMKRAEWNAFVKDQFEIWQSTNPLSMSTLDHILDFMHGLIKCDGDLQEQAIMKKEFENREHLTQALKEKLRS